jgi:osmotically-inducible protein OsmY
MATMSQSSIRTDESIRTAVVDELKWDPRIPSANDISLRVKEGVVTLTGYVHSYWEKEAAEEAAKRIYGVKGIANDIEVKLASTKSDPELARDVVHELESHVSLPAGKIKAKVENGWVTLEGNVDWQFEKTLAQTDVAKLRGVIGVTNNIEVKPRVNASEIKNKIESALQRSAALDARRITVAVTDGSHVKLSGSVRSWAERSEAERAAWAAPGTTKVDNDITIAP